MSENALKADVFVSTADYESPLSPPLNLQNPEPRALDYLGIFLLSVAILSFELTLTRVLSVVTWANLAFMVIGTALFGFGLSGVFLGLRPSFRQSTNRLGLLSLASGLSMIFALHVIRELPFRMWQFDHNPWNYAYLAGWELALVLPFFFAGILIAGLLGNYSQRAGRLYGFDLTGAAVGSGIIVFLLPAFGGEGSVFVCASIASLAGLCFLLARPSSTSVRLLLLAGIVGGMLLAPSAKDFFGLKFHGKKRRFNKAELIDTAWSSLSRVDVSHWDPDHLNTTRPMRGLWIDGGTNASVIPKWDGTEADLGKENWSTVGTVYALKEDEKPNVLIIGSSGGKEVLAALSHNASHIDAVEMDPSIHKLLSHPEMSNWMGHLYSNPRVSFIRDEGRSYLRRAPLESFDVIQFVNNYTPVAIASGALNLTETFLITKEAFIDYWHHLRPNGVLALHRGATLRVATTAIAALREMGVEDPQSHVAIVNGEFPEFQGFFLKKSPWTKEEIQKLHSYLSPIPRVMNAQVFLYNPLNSHVQGDVYSEIMRHPEHYYHSLGVDLTPVNDDRPFLEHYVKFGKSDLHAGMPPEYKRRENEKALGLIPRGDFPYAAILAESAILACLFVFVPLWKFAHRPLAERSSMALLAYFALLGLSFVLVEICLIKRYVLFLGNPAYSMATILVSLLIGAGIGSLSSEFLGRHNFRRATTTVFVCLLTVLCFEAFVSPQITNYFIAAPVMVRVLTTIVLLFPSGFAMGIPFAFGLRSISLLTADIDRRRELTAWAWGINGYTTVIGSSAAVFLALLFGFRAVLLLAAGGYALALICLMLALAPKTSLKVPVIASIIG